MFTLASVQANETLKVCSSCEFTTIGQAVAAANAFDTILIAKGVYREIEIVVDKPMTLEGEDGAVIDGKDKEGDGLRITADSVTVRGLSIRNIQTSYTKEHAGIHISECSHFTIENNKLKDIFFGILVERSGNGQIRNNTISSNAVDEISSGNGIHLFYCKSMLVAGNNVSNVRDGIYFEFVDDSRVTGNLSHNNLRYGLHFMFSNRDEYDDNIFRNNGAGVAVMFSNHIKMHDNEFVENWGRSSYGLLLKEINDGEITGNLFHRNTIAINIEGSNRINYSNNEFRSNGWALKFRGGCYRNIVTGNNFLNNTFDVSYNGKINDNSFDRNYWSSYTGYDLDRNGTGDVPFRPVKLFSYIVNENPITMVLLRSLFVDLINFSEKVSPVFTPDDLQDVNPIMKELR